MTIETNPIRSDPIYVHPDNSPAVITADFTAWLNAGIEDTISSVSTPTHADLTISGEIVNASTVTLSDGRKIRPSKSIQFSITAGLTASTTYYVKVPITLANNSNSETGVVPVIVSADDGGD